MRGLIAAMLSSRRVEPTPEQWELLRGEKEITSRCLGKVAWEIGFELEFASSAFVPMDDTMDG